MVTKKGEDGQPEIIPEEAVFVREIYDKYLDGWSLDGIRDDLNQKGVQTRRGKEWSRVSVQRILTNEKYKGAVLLQKTFVSNVLTKEVKKIQENSSNITCLTRIHRLFLLNSLIKHRKKSRAEPAKEARRPLRKLSWVSTSFQKSWFVGPVGQNTAG